MCPSHSRSLAHPRNVRHRLAPMSKFIPAVPRFPAFEDCDWYHSVDIPGHGEVAGQWDLRSNEAAYTGGIDFRGKSVLEIGPASGYLTFWMERQGASVTALDLSDDHKWDFVPYRGLDLAPANDARKTHLTRLHNSWWFLRNAYQAKANVIYGTVYDTDASLGQFDIVTLSSVLLHLREPYCAIQNAALVCAKTLIISDIAEEQFLPDWPDLWDKPILYFLPHAASKSPLDAWHFMTSTVISAMLHVLGFETVVSKHTQQFVDGPTKYYTVVGTRI